MLKTPRFPVWVCCINNSFSVLFSLNRSLLCDWKRENQFQLFYYNGQNQQRSTARLTVGEHHLHSASGPVGARSSPTAVLVVTDTQSHHWKAPPADPEGDPEKRFPSLEMTIRTKWEGAGIDWSGTEPFY